MLITFNLLSIYRKYDPNEMKSINAALRFYNVRKTEQLERTCPSNLKNDENGRLEVMSVKQLKKLNLNSNAKVLICQDLSKKALSEFKICNFDSTLPAAVRILIFFLFLFSFTAEKFIRPMLAHLEDKSSTKRRRAKENLKILFPFRFM